MIKYIILFFLTPPIFAKNAALKNFHEIYSSLGYSLNVKSDASLESTYQFLKEVLPKTGHVSEYSGPMQMASLQLSAAFCEKRITADSKVVAAERWLHKNVDFSKDASAISKSDRQKIIEDYAEVFWQRSPSSEEMVLLEAALAEFNGSPASTNNLNIFLTLLCSAFAMSTDFVTI